jgi:5-(carboxyamino)imidazole ribonucleotide mutase
MPTGVPVATVALNGAKNAAILATQILATSNQEIANKLLDYKTELNNQVLDMVERIKS